VVVDFPDAVFSSDVQGIKVGRGAVKEVRIAQHATQPSYARLVIDLTEKCDYELRTLTNGIVLKVLPKAATRHAG